jgi:Tol biopolymer transport system component
VFPPFGVVVRGLLAPRGIVKGQGMECRAVRSNAALYRARCVPAYNESKIQKHPAGVDVLERAKQQKHRRTAQRPGLRPDRRCRMSERTEASEPKAGESGRLDSWKKIAVYFKRDVTTVQRWERREGMPVHRHLHDKQGSVYAFRTELDAWWASRRGKLPDSSDAGSEVPDETPATALTSELPQAPAIQSAEPGVRQTGVRIDRPWAVAASLAALFLVVFAAVKWYTAPPPWRNPLANVTFTRLTDWPDVEQAAEISRDGRWAAFQADHDGHMDAWVTQIGSGSYRNLTRGTLSELANPSIRTLGFSADGALITVWTRKADGTRPEDVNLLAAPTAGGELRDFLPGVAEVAWSHDGASMAYHTTSPGDPLFVRDADDTYLYFTRGVPPNDWDIWRMRSTGQGLERITFHNTRVSHPVLLDKRTLVYLASDSAGAGPWLYALDLEHPVPHRISVGLERYTSLAASADGLRLVATVNDSSSGIWSASLADASLPSGPAAPRPPSMLFSTGQSPRMGPGYLLYVSARAGRQGIWKAVAGQSHELWSDAHSTLVGAPAVSSDGAHIAFTVLEGERTALYTMTSDGKALRAVSTSLPLRGSPAWAPDGLSIAQAVLHDGEPRLMRIFLDDRPPTPLVSEYSIDPVWAPDGRFLVYSGADVGTTFPLRAVAADGRPYSIPALMLTRGGRRIVLSADGRSMVVLRGEVSHKNFWLVDLKTGAERQITELAPDIAIRDFDLSRDGSAIVFDRVQESSRIALIERGG